MKIRLTDLEPRFLKVMSPAVRQFVETLEEADGVEFVCPLCLANQDMHRPGVHGVICWEPDVPLEISPGPGRWTMQGTGLHDLTLVAGSSSIHLQGPGCGAHFFIKNGEIEFTPPFPKGWQE